MELILRLLAAALLLSACGDPVQRHIDAIVEGGEDLEQAKLALNMAKGDAVAPVIRAFEDASLPVRARLDMADALYRLYLREDAPAIFESLVGALEDPLPEVRAGAARAVGNLRRRQAVEPLLTRFTAESDPRMQLEILTALEFMNLPNNNWNGHVTPHLFSEAEKSSFVADLQRALATEQPDSLRDVTMEWLEVMAEDRAREARQKVLAADVAGAEALLLSALELVPESKNISQRLGKLYYDSGDPERGTHYLEGRGMVARAAKLPMAPTLDGRLAGDPAWAGVEPLTDFHQCIWRRSALRTDGRSEAYVGYRDDTLFVAVKGYEPSTEGLVAEVSERDGQVHRDDCIEIFMDVQSRLPVLPPDDHQQPWHDRGPAPGTGLLPTRVERQSRRPYRREGHLLGRRSGHPRPSARGEGDPERGCMGLQHCSRAHRQRLGVRPVGAHLRPGAEAGPLRRVGVRVGRRVRGA
jgi:hypothetical protein